MTVEITDTKYYGITILEYGKENKYWFLTDGEGAEEGFDQKPTEIEIDKFRTAVIKYGRND